MEIIRPKCKLCSRTFANGRALGGHMKAHLATHPSPPKPHNHQESTSDSFSAAYSSSSPDSAGEENDDDKASIYGLRENPRRSLKFSDPAEAAVFRDGDESEAESTRRRPKRIRRQPWSATAEEEEDAAIAMCLVMLSRDKWTDSAAAKTDVKRHRCKVCNKAFRSSQALGGHRVTHRKEGAEKKQRRSVDDGEREKIFECPYCFKVFSSGQALGGHKRSHHLTGPEKGWPGSSSEAPDRKRNGFLDLNLPAPTEDDDDRSIVSDGDVTEPPVRNLRLGT